MAFSLGNMIKSAANTVANAASSLVSPVLGGIKNLINPLGTSSASQPQPTQTANNNANGFFTVNGNQNAGTFTNSPMPGAISTPSPSLVKLPGSGTPSVATSSTPSVKVPTVPATIPSATLTAPSTPVVTTSDPYLFMPSSSTSFTSTPQANATTPPASTATPSSTSTPSSSSSTPRSNDFSISQDLLNPTSDAAIRDTQGRITNINQQLEGKSAALFDAQARAKVPEYQQQLNDVMSQINTLNSDAMAQQIKIEGKPIASEFQSRQINAVERARTVKVLGLSAVASALQGNLALAQDYAQKATDAKFAPLEAELTTLKQQLDFNKDNFTRAEATRAQKLEVALQDRERALTDARKDQDNINAIALEAAKNGANAETLNSILNATDISTALGAARSSMAKQKGIGVYGLSEAQANIASKLADDFEKATGDFTKVRDAYSRIQSAQQGTGISDTALIFAYMKLLDPGSVVREGEFATAQNAGGVGEKFMQAYNGVLNGQKLSDSIRKDILNTSASLFGKAQETQNQIVQQYNNRANAYGIPTDLVTRDVNAGIGSQQSAMGGNSAVSSDMIYAKLKAKYPTASDADLQSVTQYYVNNPTAQSQLNLTPAPAPTNTAVTQTGTGARTDRHNNPTAFTTDIAKMAGLKEGVDYQVGDPFPNNASLKTARLLGDPIATTIKVIDKIGFQTSSGKPRWDYINMPKSQWDKLSYDQKKSVIASMYAREGGNQLKTLFA